jgi:prophage DNA circulation protein
MRRVTIGGRRLIGASFRGVAFFVEGGTRTAGRRTIVHEFPYRDDPFVEDLGRRARTFPIEGYVVGDDYLAQRDALLSALEDTAGPGELVHPSYGVKRAICVNASVRESRSEGGFAAFSIEFAETPAQSPSPTEVADAPEQVSASASAATTASDAEFASRYSVAGLPGFALESAATAFTRATTGVAELLAPIVQSTQELAELTGRVALMTAQAASLVRQPASVLAAFRDVIRGLVDTIAAAPGAVMEALIDACAVDLGRLALPNTSTRERELANQTALIGALRRTMAIEASQIAPNVPYVSIDEATSARDRIAAQLQEQAADAGDDAYPALVSLRSSLLRAVPGGSAFARVVSVTRNIPLPSLLVSYQLYGSVRLEQDIISRNAIQHPGFVVGDLKVLSDG